MCLISEVLRVKNMRLILTEQNTLLKKLSLCMKNLKNAVYCIASNVKLRTALLLAFEALKIL